MFPRVHPQGLFRIAGDAGGGGGGIGEGPVAAQAAGEGDLHGQVVEIPLQAGNVDFDDLDQVVPVFLMLLAMPISGSIGHGIGLGLISYSVLKLCTGKGKEVSVLTYVISVIFLVKFFLVA